MDEAALEAEAILFEPRDGLMFNESYELGYNDKAFQGDAFYTAPNPPLGVVFTYYLKEGLETLRDQRRREGETEDGRRRGELPELGRAAARGSGAGARWSC